MAFGTQPADILAAFLQPEGNEMQDDLTELGERNASRGALPQIQGGRIPVPQIQGGRIPVPQIQRGRIPVAHFAGGGIAVPQIQGSTIAVPHIQGIEAAALHAANQLVGENLVLRAELHKLQDALQNSKIDTADVCSKFGELAKEWKDTVRRLNDLLKQERKDYEKRIDALEKTNQQLIKENQEMKVVIRDLQDMVSKLEKEKRVLKLGQIAFKLEMLVSEYVFPGEDRESKRARYGTKLKSLREKIGNLKDQTVRDEALKRVEDLDTEMFEDWFLGVMSELKNVRVGTAHPDLGNYDEIKQVIDEEFGNDDDKREDMLAALGCLRRMYVKLNRPFGY